MAGLVIKLSECPTFKLSGENEAREVEGKAVSYQWIKYRKTDTNSDLVKYERKHIVRKQSFKNSAKI